MKTALKYFRTLLFFSAIVAVPQLASAAGNRTFTSVTPNPASTNVTAGAATVNTSTVSVRNGSGASTRFIGTAMLTAYVTPSDPTVTASLSPTNLTFPNSDTTLTSTLTVTTMAATPAGIYVVSIVANTNLPAQSSITPVTNTFTLSVGAVFVPQTFWTNGAVNTNWSTAANWTGNAVPVSSNDVVFTDVLNVGTPGQVDNVVDTNLTIGSLTYGQTNLYHTTLIASGKTLTVGGDANGLVAGTGTDPGDSIVPGAAITGAGALLAVTNTGANVFVGQSHNVVSPNVSHSQAALDMSGLGQNSRRRFPACWWAWIFHSKVRAAC